MATLKAELREILERYEIDPRDPEGCWLWTRSKDRHGYGHFHFNGRIRMVHRVVYHLVFGVDPVGLVVMHKCDQRACINPRHLVLGTQLDNIADRVAKGRNGAAYGERASTAKLTYETVKQLREDRRNGAGLSRLAKKFGISKTQASRIVRGQSWRASWLS